MNIVAESLEAGEGKIFAPVELKYPPSGVTIVGQLDPIIIAEELHSIAGLSEDQLLGYEPAHTAVFSADDEIKDQPSTIAKVATIARQFYPIAQLEVFAWQEPYDEKTGLDLPTRFLGVHYDGNEFFIVNDEHSTRFFPTLNGEADTGRFWTAPCGAIVKVDRYAYHSAPPLIGSGVRRRIKAIALT